MWLSKKAEFLGVFVFSGELANYTDWFVTQLVLRFDFFDKSHGSVAIREADLRYPDIWIERGLSGFVEARIRNLPDGIEGYSVTITAAGGHHIH
ncbi:MAG: hypothetical protein FJ087_19970 [Deltaproteobacteria bacterium]|nr:hypothetical protein [Deltaproteobacteria bacterium]